MQRVSGSIKLQYWFASTVANERIDDGTSLIQSASQVKGTTSPWKNDTRDRSSKCHTPKIYASMRAVYLCEKKNHTCNFKVMRE